MHTKLSTLALALGVDKEITGMTSTHTACPVFYTSFGRHHQHTAIQQVRRRSPDTPFLYLLHLPIGILCRTNALEFKLQQLANA